VRWRCAMSWHALCCIAVWLGTYAERTYVGMCLIPNGMPSLASTNQNPSAFRMQRCFATASASTPKTLLLSQLQEGLARGGPAWRLTCEVQLCELVAPQHERL
jgi:hypothetical protein